MGKFSILICDSDACYSRRLAAGLRRIFQDKALIRTAEAYCPQLLRKDTMVQFVLAAEGPEQEYLSEKSCIWIRLDEETDVSESVRNRIYKYRAVSWIARELMRYLPESCRTADRADAEAVKWYGVLSPVRHEALLPFAFSMARALEAGCQTLVLLLMEFAGAERLLGRSVSCGQDEFLLQLRQKAQNERGEQASVQMMEPEILRFPGFDLLNLTMNPMILHELTEEDLQRIRKWICANGQYQRVVWAAGNVLQGVPELLQDSEQVYVLEKADGASRCCQWEFDTFLDKLQVEPERISRLRLPVPAWTEPGEHLLLQWEQSVIGETVCRCLKGGDADGASDRRTAKPDIRTAGYQL